MMKTVTRKSKCEEKQLCGYFKQQICEISNEKTRKWIRRGNLKRELESLLIIAQNNAIDINYVKEK